MTKRVCQVSLSVIDSDPRVQRTIAALEKEQYEVTAVGYGWGLLQTSFGFKEKAFTTLRQLSARCVPALAHQLYWAKAENRQLYHRILEHKPDIVHAHDWSALPAAAHAANKLNVPLIYDSHEFGREQLLHRRMWRMIYPAYIAELENTYSKQADELITISDGCGRLLQDACGLKQAPTIVRNTPFYQQSSFKPCEDQRVTVHFHGYFTPGRGLRNLIRSVSMWPTGYRLRITGWGNDQRFVNELHALAHEHGSDRIEFHDKVPAQGLNQHANTADIGIVFSDTISAQFDIALPNKLFEYVMAGLMLIVGPGREMHQLMQEYELGVSLSSNRPKALAAALADLTPQQIDHHKQEALAAAKELCWEQEQKKLLAVYNSL